MLIKNLRGPIGLVAGAVALALGGPAHADVVISQVYGGGGNSGATLKHDFIELFNNGSEEVNLSGWSLQYASSTGTSWTNKTALSGSLKPGQYLLVQQAAGAGGTENLPTPDLTGTINMSGTAGKVALVRHNTALTGSCPGTDAGVVDFVGFGTATNCSLTAPTATLSNSSAALRKSNGCTNTRNNSADFAVGTPTPRNSASPLNVCGGAPAPTAPKLTAAASPASVVTGETTLLTATIVPGANPTSSGLNATVDLSGLGGSATQALYDDGTHGDAVAGDLTFSYRLTIANGTAGGNRTLAFSASDAEGRSASGSATLGVVALTTISAIQGSGDASPLNGATVVTEGIVTGVRSNGFYIQTAAGQDDGDPSTSEGLLVFTSARPNAAVVALGNRVRVQGKVTEFVPANSTQFPLTELTSPTVSLLSTGHPLPAPVVLSDAILNPSVARNTLERFEGMRVAAACLDVVAPTLGSVNESQATSSGNGVFNAVLCGTKRPMREPGLHPNDAVAAPAGTPRFDGNPELLRIDSRALGGSALTLDVGAQLTEVNGVLDYAFGAYSLLPDAAGAMQVKPGHAPRAVAKPDYETFTVAGFNLLRFFDDQNDPAIGEPVLTPSAYAFRLAKTANAICDYLHAPDILGVVEVESLPVLARLAQEINTTCPAAPQYVAYLMEGNDVGGIDVGFLVSTREVKPGLPRVTVRGVEQVGKDTTWVQPDGASDLLNDRPSLILEATVNQDNGNGYDITVITNHLRSLSGANTNDAGGARVRAKRLAQAQFLAQVIEDRQRAKPDERVVLVGDFNAFEFNDGLVDSMGIITGYPAGPNEVALYGASPITRPLRNLTLDEPVEERYSFVFDGNAQTLDHMLVNQPLLTGAKIHVDHARLNADFSEARFGDAANDARVSDHDPVIGYFTVDAFRTADLSVAATADVGEVRVGSRTGFGVSVRNAGPSTAPATLELALPFAAQPISVTAPAGWSCGNPTRDAELARVQCNHAGLAQGALAQFRVEAAANDALGGGDLNLRANVRSVVADVTPGNNSAAAQTRVNAAANLSLSLAGPHTPIVVGRGGDFALRIANAGPDAAWAPRLTLAFNAPAEALRVTAPAGWSCRTAQNTTARSVIECLVDGRYANAASSGFLLHADPPRHAPIQMFTLDASVDSTTPDADRANNRASASQRVTGYPSFGG